MWLFLNCNAFDCSNACAIWPETIIAGAMFYHCRLGQEVAKGSVPYTKRGSTVTTDTSKTSLAASPDDENCGNCQSSQCKYYDFAAMSAEISNSIIFAWNLDDDRVDVIAGSHESFGISCDAKTNRPAWWFDKIHPDDIHRVKGLVTSIAIGQEKISCEYRLRRDDGTWVDVLDRAKVIWRDGRVHQFIGVSTDVSLLVATRRELATAMENAEKASSIKSRFLANMSHELRTPLNAIMSSIDLIRSTRMGLFESKKLLSVIQRNARHVLRLVDDILDLAKVEAEMLRIDPATIHLRPFLAETTEVFQLNANAKNLSFTLAIEGDVPETVYTDPGRLRQILNNLIGNALKFTECGFVRVQAKMDGRTIEFRVADSGPGIDGTEAQKLFTPFVQLDESLSRRFGGTGLGLSLSLKLAARLGGTLSLESSTPNQGSTFLLTLPATSPSVAETASEPPYKRRLFSSKKRILSGKRILLVDDAIDNRMLFQKILELHGAAVVLAANGRDCVKHIADCKNKAALPDIILMDIEMPVMDGPTALMELRNSGNTIPVIAMTAHAMPEHRQEYMRLGFNGYISKPVDQQQLIDLICSKTAILMKT